MNKKLNSNQLRVNWSCNLIFAVLLVLSCAVQVNANLIYSGSILTEEDDTGSFNLSNSQSLSLGLSQKLTNFLSADEMLRYFYHSSESRPRLEQLAPSIDLINDNLLLRLNLSVSTSMVLGENENLDDKAFYEMGFRSKWRSDLVPALQVVVNQRSNSNNPSPARYSLGRNSLSTTLDWDRHPLGLYYNHRLDKEFSQQGDRLFTIESQHGSLKFGKSYWDKTLQVRFSHEYTNVKNVREASATAGNLISQPILEVRSGIDNTPADPFEAATVNPLLRDGNLLTTAYSVASSSSFNNIMLALSGQVDQISLYTSTDLSATPLTGLTWTLFTNDVLGTAWDPVILPPSAVVYIGNVPEPYFEIKVAALSANYLKLVLDIPLAGPAVDFTEVRVFDSRILATSENVTLNTTNNTSLNLGGRLSRNWSYNYRANLFSMEVEGAGFNEQERLSQGGDLRYNSSDGTFSSVVGFSIFNSKIDRQLLIAENESVHYSVDMDKQFLPTLSVGIGWELSELSAASVRLTETSLYRFDSLAQLYPDLSLNFEVDASERESFQDLSKKSSILAKVALTSRLKPGLFLQLREGYAAEGSEFDSLGQKTNTSDIVLRWRPSDDLYFNGSASYSDNESPEPNSTSLAVGMNLVVVEGVLLEADYSSTKGENDSQVGEVSLNWYLKKGLRIDSGCKYHHVTGQVAKDFSAYGRLIVNFALP